MHQYLTKQDLLSFKKYLDTIVVYIKNNTERVDETELLLSTMEFLHVLSGKLNAPVKYLSVESAATCFGIEEGDIDNAIKDGKIGYSQLGGVKMVSINELERHIESNFVYEPNEFSLDCTLYSSTFKN